jgi:hypothetical protein
VDRRRLSGFALGALAVAVALGTTLVGSTRHLVLNFGPGDTPFVRGFQADSDVEDKVGWHWTTYDAGVSLPFETTGSDVRATLRYARVFGEEALVDVRIGAVSTEPFRARGGEIRTTGLVAPSVQGPLDLSVRTDSHERRNMGLRLDVLTLDATGGAPFKMKGSASVRPALTALLLFAGLMLLGSSPFAAGSFCLIGALLFAARASVDLFGAWRQTYLAPEMLVLATVVLFVGRAFLHSGAGIEKTTAATLSSAALITMLARLALVSHPDFYYPDLLTHTRVVQAIREEGPAFFLHPADALSAQKAWTKPVLGSVAALPYAVMFHTPFALLAGGFGLSNDEVESAIKAASSLISVLPILLAGALAARFSLPPRAALMLCVIPTYTSRLSFALLPALTGHAFDLAALLVIATLTGREIQLPRLVASVTAALLAGHLAYTSSVVNEGVFMAVLVALYLAAGRPFLRVSISLFASEAAAALGAFFLYYRNFVADVAAVAARILGVGGGGGPAKSVYAVESFWSVLFERTNTFFGWPYIGLALLGVWMGGPALRESKIVRAWGLSYLVLIVLRARVPDVFRYGHETLFLTPLVALLAGTALVIAHQRGGMSRLMGWVGGLALLGHSLWQQALSIGDQLANAL